MIGFFVTRISTTNNLRTTHFCVFVVRRKMKKKARPDSGGFRAVSSNIVSPNQLIQYCNELVLRIEFWLASKEENKER